METMTGSDVGSDDTDAGLGESAGSKSSSVHDFDQRNSDPDVDDDHSWLDPRTIATSSRSKVVSSNLEQQVEQFIADTCGCKHAPGRKPCSSLFTKSEFMTMVMESASLDRYENHVNKLDFAIISKFFNNLFADFIEDFYSLCTIFLR